MLRTDLDILTFIDEQPDRTVTFDQIKAFIEVNAEHRLFEMKQARLIRCNPHWWDPSPAMYTVDAQGDALLAEHQQKLEQERQRKAEAEAEKEAEKLESRKEAVRSWCGELVSGSLSNAVGSVVASVVDKIVK